MNVLVTGAAGFMGSHVAERLVANGHTVWGLDDLSGGFRENVPSGVQFVEGSIGDRGLVEGLFERFGFEAVLHLAAYAAEGLSHFIKRFNYDNNVMGTMNLLTCAVNHDVRVFVFTSSIAVYGSAQLPMTESMRPEPEDSYGIAKFTVEMELEATQRLFGLPYVVFRPHNVYGERQNIADRYRNVIGIFIRQAMLGEPMTVFGDGRQTRAFTHIDDVAPIIAASVEEPRSWNQTFNIGADERCEVIAVAEHVSRAFGIPTRVRHLPPRLEVQHAYADHTKLRELFGTTSSVLLDAGIARMAAWARARGLPRPTPAPAVEIPRNLPVGWS